MGEDRRLTTPQPGLALLPDADAVASALGVTWALLASTLKTGWAREAGGVHTLVAGARPDEVIAVASGMVAGDDVPLMAAAGPIEVSPVDGLSLRALAATRGAASLRGGWSRVRRPDGAIGPGNHRGRARTKGGPGLRRRGRRRGGSHSE